MAPRGPKPKPFQLLEINLISGQDLEPVFKNMKTYARAWVNPARKLSSCVSSDGNNNPTWNDKFVFRVDDEFLKEDKSSVMIEIYATHWLHDVIVGTLRVLVANLVPPPVLTRGRMRFVALQVRRPSGRPQGILNIGVALLDGSMRSMPLSTQLSPSAVGFRDLQTKEPKQNPDTNTVKPILLRSRSEKSERVAFDNYSPNSSIVAIPIGKNKGRAAKESSIISISDVHPFRDQPKKKQRKASLVISGAELREKNNKDEKGGKPGSVVSDSVYSKVSSRFYKRESPKPLENDKKKPAGLAGPGFEAPTNKVVDEKSITRVKDRTPVRPGLMGGYGAFGPKGKGNSMWSDSEVGPSPSEVAAALAAAERRYPLNDGNESSVLDGWSVDESVEGLRSKLERWRRELPPLYDNNNGFSTSSYRSSSQYGRRGGGGSGRSMFSCFGNICGYECQCVCGKPPGRRSYGSRFMSSSVGTSAGRSFI